MTTTTTHTTTETYDPEAIAAAVLADQLTAMIDMDGESIVDICDEAELPVPDDDDDDGWNAVGSALGQLADQIREHLGTDEQFPAV